MEDLILKQLQLCAIHNVMARTSDANNATMATRIGELNSLHISASMDIKKIKEQEIDDIYDFLEVLEEYGHVYHYPPEKLDEPFKKILVI